jgi:hypothetical protein
MTDKDNRQWYFIQQGTRSHFWVATQPVPSTYQLGRQSIVHMTDQAADVDNDNTGQNQSSSMATQTATMPAVMAAAALTLAGTKTGQVQSFFRMKKPGSGLPRGTGGPPLGGGGPPGAPGSGLPGGLFSIPLECALGCMTLCGTVQHGFLSTNSVLAFHSAS